MSHFAGSVTSDADSSRDGIGTNARFSHPTGIVFEKHGNLIVSDTNRHMLRLISPTGKFIKHSKNKTFLRGEGNNCI